MNKMNNRFRYENCFISHDHDVLYWQLVMSSYWFFSDEGTQTFDACHILLVLNLEAEYFKPIFVS